MHCQKGEPNPAVRLGFELGSLSEISLVYRPPKGDVNQVFDQLKASLRTHYGDTAHSRELDASCKASLHACLLSGTEPDILSWNFANGSIELQARVDGETPALIVRYAQN